MTNRRLHNAVVTLVLVMAAVPAFSVMQERFVDDAGRTVNLPARRARVFAAGAPAEVMLYTLAPDRLVGRNRFPSDDALAFFPPAYRNPTLIRQLPEVDNPSADAELVALKPDLYIDYGTVEDDYIASLEAVQRRTGVPGIILNGSLARIPDMYKRLGAVLGLADRGERLGAAADRLLTRYRSALAGSGSVRVYVACSSDGYVPCVEDETGGEQLRWLGGVNVAGTRATAPRRPLTIDEIKAMAPQVIVVNAGAARFRSDPAWTNVEAVRAGRIYEWPALPYSWGSRPPSVNRLLGVAWLARIARGDRFDAGFESEVRDFFREFYHLDLTASQLQTLLPPEASVTTINGRR